MLFRCLTFPNINFSNPIYKKFLCENISINLSGKNILILGYWSNQNGVGEKGGK
jgi:hypothetical protein